MRRVLKNFSDFSWIFVFIFLDMLKKFIAIRILFFLIFLNFANQLFADEFLPPEKAFVGSIENITFDKNNNSAELNIFYEIANNYYLYKNNTKVVINDDTKSLMLNNILLPAGVIKNDENFGEVEVFFNQLKVVVNLKLSNDVDENFLANFFKNNGVNISVQGCAENGICYPPLLQTLKFSGEISKKNLTNLVENSQDETSQIAQMLNNKNFFATLLFFLLAGLGLAFTPCVLPMIPILSAMLAKQNSQNNSVLLSILYVLGMALTYSIIGVIAGLTGTLLNQLIQNNYVLITISFIFVLLALSMFGFYELQLPNCWQNKINEKNNQISKGKIGVFIMGILSALVVSPCVVAPLAGALLYIGQTGDAIFGGIALFCMAIGMGIPLIAVGFAGKKLLPKAGSWMLQVKKFFGVVMLAIALWLLRPLLSPFWWIFSWALLLIFCGIFLKAIDSLSADATALQRFFKAIGFVILLCGILLFVGAISGANDIFNPLSQFKYSKYSGQNSEKIAENRLNFVEIHTEKDLENAMNSPKTALIEFSAEWCISCKEIQRDVFANPQIMEKIKAKSLQLFQIDVSENTEIQRKFLQKFNLYGPPGILFFQNGEELQNLRIVGYKNADEFSHILAKIN